MLRLEHLLSPEGWLAPLLIRQKSRPPLTTQRLTFGRGLPAANVNSIGSAMRPFSVADSVSPPCLWPDADDSLRQEHIKFPKNGGEHHEENTFSSLICSCDFGRRTFSFGFGRAFERLSFFAGCLSGVAS
jgi:hypothetical protein